MIKQIKRLLVAILLICTPSVTHAIIFGPITTALGHYKAKKQAAICAKYMADIKILKPMVTRMTELEYKESLTPEEHKELVLMQESIRNILAKYNIEKKFLTIRHTTLLEFLQYKHEKHVIYKKAWKSAKTLGIIETVCEAIVLACVLVGTHALMRHKGWYNKIWDKVKEHHEFINNYGFSYWIDDILHGNRQTQGYEYDAQ